MLKEKIVDIKTGKETFRDYTEVEIAEVKAEIAAKTAEAIARKEAEAAKNAEKAALLKRLGITEEEAQLLLS